MPTLYLIGGSPRAGKSTIATKVMQQLQIHTVSCDALRCATRNVLFGEPYVSVERIHFDGDVTFHRPGSLEQHRREFTYGTEHGEEELNWRAIEGVINHYDRQGQDVMLEGVTITPERVHSLKLTSLDVAAVFVGFSSPGYADTILSHAKKNPKDWVNLAVQESGGDEQAFRGWVAEEVVASQQRREAAEGFGYGYFDLSASAFSEHVDNAATYLLNR